MVQGTCGHACGGNSREASSICHIEELHELVTPSVAKHNLDWPIMQEVVVNSKTVDTWCTTSRQKIAHSSLVSILRCLELAGISTQLMWTMSNCSIVVDLAQVWRDAKGGRDSLMTWPLWVHKCTWPLGVGLSTRLYCVSDLFWCLKGCFCQPWTLLFLVT